MLKIKTTLFILFLFVTHLTYSYKFADFPLGVWNQIREFLAQECTSLLYTSELFEKPLVGDLNAQSSDNPLKQEWDEKVNNVLNNKTIAILPASIKKYSTDGAAKFRHVLIKDDRETVEDIDSCINGLSRFSNLQTLIINKSKISRLGFLLELKELVLLDLSDCVDIKENEFINIGSLHDLESLNLESCKIKNQIEVLANLTHLKHLSLANCIELEPYLLNNLGYLASLEWLDLSKTRLKNLMNFQVNDKLKCFRAFDCEKLQIDELNEFSIRYPNILVKPQGNLSEELSSTALTFKEQIEEDLRKYNLLYGDHSEPKEATVCNLPNASNSIKASKRSGSTAAEGDRNKGANNPPHLKNLNEMSALLEHDPNRDGSIIHASQLPQTQTFDYLGDQPSCCACNIM